MSLPEPEITDANRPYFEALAKGRLAFPRCTACGHAFLPPRAACPACLSPDLAWETASGRARILSWVVYHMAYADHLKDRVPYDVTLVELEEGPRLLTNIVGSEAGRALRPGLPVRLKIEREDGQALARFEIAQDADHA